jgi:UDP-N-acetylmuramoyl-tripeptide--D-alanyl-D-alanine ligase
MKLSLAEAAIGAGAVLEAPADVANAGALMACGYSIDSRTVAAGELFFAVKGERLDGHDFLENAFKQGAVAAVVSRARVASLSDAVLAAPLLIAEDPLAALQALAANVRRRWGRRVVAITGSAGKTTTKDAVAAALGAKLNVLKSRGNLNNGFGLPLQLLRLEPEHDIAVVEMGMNHAGEIAVLARIAAPDWGVVTNVGTAHIENFTDGQAGIARAKLELVAALPETGVAFLNCDDAYVSQFGRDFSGRVVYFGAGPCADPQTLEAVEDAAGLHVKFRAGERVGEVSLQLLGTHNASNAMAGLAVALEAGVGLDAAIAALATLTAGDKRGEIIQINGATILNDSYNSNPEALRSMIRTLASRAAGAPHPGCWRDAGTGRIRACDARGLRAHRRRGGHRSSGRRAGQCCSSRDCRLHRRGSFTLSAECRGSWKLAQANASARRCCLGQRLARRSSGAGHQDRHGCGDAP